MSTFSTVIVLLLLQDILPEVVKLDGEMFSPQSQLRGISQFQATKVIFEDAAHCVRLGY